MTDLTAPPIGLLRDVKIQEAFPGEASHFTPWLAREEPLAYLGDRIGLGTLSLIQTEVPIPGGRALDILAETADGRRVAIENQFRSADHDHLTRGLAYAVGAHTSALVVIAEGHRAEFVAVAEYLNRVAEQAEEGIAVFLVRARVVALGPSTAVDFDLVSGPNAWRAATGRVVAAPNPELLAFWQRFLDCGEDLEVIQLLGPAKPSNTLAFRLSPNDRQWFYVSVAKSYSYAYLSLDGGQDESTKAFKRIEEDRAGVEALFGGPLVWQPREDRYTSVIATERMPFGYQTQPSDEQLHELALVLERFKRALEANVRALP